MAVELPDPERWFTDDHGFPHPDWEAIAEWIERSVPGAEVEEAWQRCTRCWLQRLAGRIGDGYATVESQNFHLLSDLPADARRSKLVFLEDARSHMCRVFGDMSSAASGKHVVLRFREIQHFYAYISHFHSDGDYAGAAGMFLSDGYDHIAYAQGWTDHDERPLLVHELAHVFVAHLPLPAWLNEALAMAFEAEIAGSQLPPLTRELAERHREYWTADTIQEFWQGLAFSSVDGQELAYSLSRVLLNLIHTELRPSQPEFRSFVGNAHRNDAGAEAAEEHLQIPLANIVAAFLGPGDWAPRRER
jgi:hypothetical protein